MKLVIDLSQHNWNLTDAQWDIFGEILDGVIIRMSYGRSIDSKAQAHIDQCNRVGLPYICYSWIDPTSDFQGQINTVIAARKQFNPASVILDFEQYWSDWAAWKRQDWAEAYRTRFTPEQLNSYYKKFFTASKTYVGVTIGCYSSDSFMKDYCPAMFDWVPFNNYWRAAYPPNTEHYEPEEVRAFAETIDLTGCIGRQFSNGLDVTGLPGVGQLDWNAFSEEGFRILFGENAMSKNIIFEPFIPQLGPGADAHNNDCGPACVCNMIYKRWGIVLSPDEVYNIPGWGAPTTDIGTNAYQLQLLLNDFDVPNTIGTTLDNSMLEQFIDSDIPLIVLVKYGLFSAAGLTVKKGTFNHWLIVSGYTDTEIITVDPYRPYESGGIMIVPKKMFFDSYLGTFIACNITEVQMSTAIVNNLKGLNIRKGPTSASTDIGDLINGQKIILKDPVVTIRGTDGLDWVELEIPQPGVRLLVASTVAWVAKMYLKDIVITPPPVTPPAIDEKSIRLDEINKAKLSIEQYFTYRRNEIDLL